MKTLFLLSFWFLVSSLHSEAQQMAFGKVTKQYEINEVPAYFFKVRDDGKIISFASKDEHNNVFDLQSGKIYPAPGPFDPVLIPQTNLMIAALFNAGRDSDIYGVYDLLTVMLNGRQATPLLVLKNLHGVYQSAGILAQSANGTQKIRIIAEGYTTHYLAEIEYNATTGRALETTDAVIPLCPSLGVLKLPMLSKDGKYMGALDVQTQTSGIFKINEDHTCEKVKDLRVKTGKMNFNYGSNKITYHIYNQNVEMGDQGVYIPTPDGTFVSDIFVLDLNSELTKRITANKDFNALYPDFTLDGTLVFMTAPHDQSKKINFTFVDLN